MAALQDVFFGTFKLEKSENFDDFLKAKGVGLIKRKAMQAMSPTKSFSKEGEEFSVTTGTPKGNFTVKFKSGETKQVKGPDGKEMKIKFTITENGFVLVEEVESEEGTELRKYKRKGDHLVLKLVHGDVKAKRFFKKQ